MATKITLALKNKRILITAGPTWVAIDDVRVISNTATGETGVILAEKFRDSGAKVTLLLGPVSACCVNKNINLLRFRFFEELRKHIITELTSKEYDIVIQTAAVSDYKPEKTAKHKVKSDKLTWQLTLVPTAKLIDLVKKIDNTVFLVGFKFEPQASRNILINNAKELMKRSQADLVVANTASKERYLAYIINRRDTLGPWPTREKLAENLIKTIGENTWKN